MWPPHPLWGIPPILGLKTQFFTFFHAFLALCGPLYGLLGPFLTSFNAKKTSFLALLGKNFPEKVSGLSVPPPSAKGVGGRGGWYPLTDKIR